MYFSIPETEENKDASGTNYTLYLIHLNGAHHCSVRFSQLFYLNEQLSKAFPPTNGIKYLPAFPPKKLFALSEEEKIERKNQLEKYIQIISQDAKIVSNPVFKTFFLNAQKESQKQSDLTVEITIHTLSGEKIKLTINPYDQTEDVLEKIAKTLQLSDELTYYFGLYLIKKDNDEPLFIVRKLQDFESPYMSLKSANNAETHKILFRKAVFDNLFEEKMLSDKVALDLVYHQALYELQIGWILPSSDVTKKIKSLQEKEAKLELVNLLMQQKYYGYIHFKKCKTDHPEPDSTVMISIGSNNLNFRIQSQEPEEFNFKITRIKCWRITTISHSDGTKSLELSIEYLFSKDNLKWFTIHSEQAIFISMSLQNMVDEILLRKNGKAVKTPNERTKATKTDYLSKKKQLINNISHEDNEVTNNVVQNEKEYDDTIGDDDL